MENKKTIEELFKQLDDLSDKLDAATPNVICTFGDDPTPLSTKELARKLRPGIMKALDKFSLDQEEGKNGKTK